MTTDIVLFSRVLMKDIAFEPSSFISILLRYEAKCMKLVNKSRKSEMKMLNEEILTLVGEKREEPKKACRKLLYASAEEPMYLTRS